MALGAGVGAELCVAANAHRPPLVTDEPLPPEVLAAVETLRAVRHRQDTVPPAARTEGREEVKALPSNGGKHHTCFMTTDNGSYFMIHGSKWILVVCGFN